jgi:ATP-dependent RNA helicase SUPV3L1/SUV3
MKPKPANLLSILTAYSAGGDKNPFLPFAGVTSIPKNEDFLKNHYSDQAIALAGYRIVGPRIVRLDMLNRLSDQIRQAQQQLDISSGEKKFQIMQEMLAIMGCTYIELQGVLQNLGFHSKVIDTTQIGTKNTDAKITENKTTNTTNLVKFEEDKNKENPQVTNDISRNKDVKKLNVYHHRVINKDGTTEEVLNTEYWFVTKRKYTDNNNTRKTNSNNKKSNTIRKKTSNNQSNREQYYKKNAKVKNSPFAMLEALKKNSEV